MLANLPTSFSSSLLFLDAFKSVRYDDYSKKTFPLKKEIFRSPPLTSKKSEQ